MSTSTHDTNILGKLSADVLLDRLEATPVTTSSKHVIEHLREPERTALFQELLRRSQAEIELAASTETTSDVSDSPKTTLEIVSCGPVDILPFFVERDSKKSPGPNRGTEAFASRLRDFFATGVKERPRALLTLTPAGNETQRSAADPLVDRKLLTLEGLTEKLLEQRGVAADDRRREPIKLLLDRTPEELPWEQTLRRIDEFLEATDEMPSQQVGAELPRLGIFFTDGNQDWDSGQPRFGKKSGLSGSSRLEENAKCFQTVENWFSDALVDAEEKIKATFLPRAAEPLLSGDRAEIDFATIEPAEKSTKVHNSFHLDGIEIEGALSHQLLRESEHPILLIAAPVEERVRIIVPLTDGKQPQDHLHLVTWDCSKNKPTSDKESVNWSAESGAEVITLRRWRRSFFVQQVLLTRGPRTLRNPYDTLWVVVYGSTAPALAIETNQRLSLEYQAWEPSLKDSDVAYFELWTPEVEEDRPVVTFGQEDGEVVDDVAEEVLAGEESITKVSFEPHGLPLTARIYWTDETAEELDDTQLEGDYLEEIPYLRLAKDVRERLVLGLQSQPSYLAAITHQSLQGDVWQLRLGETAKLRVRSHDDHGAESAQGWLLGNPEALSVARRPSADGETTELVERPLPEAAVEPLEPYLKARRALFQALRGEVAARLGKKKKALSQGQTPVSLPLLDLLPHAARIKAYVTTWLELLEARTTQRESMGPVHTALLDTDSMVELDDEGALDRLTLLPSHPWLLAALLQFQQTMIEETRTFTPGKKPSGARFLSREEVDLLAHPVPLDEWSFESEPDVLRRVDSPPFHWAFLPIKKQRREGGQGYVRRVVRLRLKRYLQMHQHLTDARRTLRLGFVNPGLGDALLAGIRDWIQLDQPREESIPNIEVLMFHDGAVEEEAVGRAFDELFQRKLRSSEENEVDEKLLQKLHYTKRNRRWPQQEEDYVHLCFVHHLLSSDSYRPREQEIHKGWDGCFGDGLLATPLRQTSLNEANGKLESSRGLWIGPGDAPLRRGLARLLVLVRGRSQGMIQPGDSLYSVVELPTLKQMRSMYQQSDWVIHLDRELSLDLFEVFDESRDEDTPTVIEYSDQEDPLTPGYDTITVTRNARPYVEQLSSVLELAGLSVTTLSPLERRRQAGLLRDINVLSGSWALDFLLGNIAQPALSTRLKGNVGAALVYRWLERIERPQLLKRFGRDLVPIYISLEELIRATPAAGLPIKDGMFQRFSNEAGGKDQEKLRKICDDLLVFYMTLPTPGQPTRFFGRVIEVKFGETAHQKKSLDAALEQVKHTQKLLSEHMSGQSSARGAPFRYKQLALLLKTQLEQARCLRVVDEADLEKLDLWRLSTDLASGNFRVDYEPGGFKGDTFLLSTQPSEKLSGEAEVEFMEGVRIIRLERASLEWLAFQPEDSPTLLETPTTTAPEFDQAPSWVPGGLPEPLSAGTPEEQEPTAAPEPAAVATSPEPPAPVPAESDTIAPTEPTKPAFVPPPVPAPEPTPEPEQLPLISLKEAITIAVAEAPYERAELQPILKRLDRALGGHKIKLESPLSSEQVDLGPRLLRVYARLQAGTTIKSIRGISEDLAREVGTVSADVHICNVPERHAVGVDLPIEGMGYTVTYEQLEAHPSFKAAEHGLTLGFCAGIDVTGRPIWVDLETMPHMLVAGTTGSGKTVFLRSALLTLLQHHRADQLEVRMSSSKPMDFMPFTRVPHGRDHSIADDHDAALQMVQQLVAEMDRRIKLISEALCDNLTEYNEDPDTKEKLPHVVAVIDEYAETVISFSEKSDRTEFESAVARLAQKARAAGIHLILCMQRPDSTVIEGRIKSNVLHRFALKLPQSHDSRVILDESGAEALLGRGDMLYKNADSRLYRLQVPFLEKTVLKKRLKSLHKQGG